MVPLPFPNRFEHGSATLWLSPEVRYVHYDKIQGDLDDNAWYKGMERAAALVLVQTIECIIADSFLCL